MVSGNWETGLRRANSTPAQSRNKNINGNLRSVRLPKPPDFFCPWDVDDDLIDDDIEIWANKKRKDVASLSNFGELRPRKGRDWEKYTCSPNHACPTIADPEQFRQDSLIDELRRPKSPKIQMVEKEIKKPKAEAESKPIQKNNIIRRPPPSLQNEKAKPKPVIRPLAIRRNNRHVVDEDEDDDKKDGKWALAPHVMDPQTVVPDAMKVDVSLEPSRLQNAKIIQKQGEPSSVKLCYTQAAMKQKLVKNDEQKRIQEMRKLNDVKTRYARYDKTGKPEETCSQKADTKESVPQAEINFYRERSKSLKEEKSSADLKPITLVLRKLSGTPRPEDDRRRLSRPDLITDNQEVSVLQREFQEFRMGSLINAMNAGVVLNKVSPLTDGLPNQEPNLRAYQSRPLPGVEKIPRRRDDICEVLDTNNIMNEIAEIIQLRDLSHVPDRYARTSPIGPPGFRPVPGRSPLQRARDNSKRRKHGSVDYEDRRKGLPPQPRAASRLDRSRSALSRPQSRPETGIT